MSLFKKRVWMFLWMAAYAATAAMDWRAQWIWLPKDDPTDMMLARRTFVLQDVPPSSTLSITASSRYELMVNGQPVGRGPARCAPHHQEFDRYDVGDLLHPGTNCIAARVHFQRGQVSYTDLPRAGLLIQLDGTDIQTDASWRVNGDASWDNESPRMARFHPEVCDRVDLRAAQMGWATVDFDDSDWNKAQVLQRETGWPAPQPDERPGHLVPPWTSLNERSIPCLTETVVLADRVVQLGGGAGGTPAVQLGGGAGGTPAVQLGGGAPAVQGVDPDQCDVVVYDFGEVHYGRPMLDLQAPAGTGVEILSAPYLMDGEIRSTIVASTYTDRIVCSGRREQWTAFYEKPVRWMAVVFRSPAGQAVIHEAAVRCSTYPFAEQGRIELPQGPGLETLWDASAKTIRVCTSDAYTDNYRERRQYAQTSYYACLGNYALFGDTALQRRYLKQIAQEQLANGIMPAYAPRHDGDFMVILDSNCFWIRGLAQYLVHSGDRGTVRDLLPAARKLMRLFRDCSNGAGLIDSPPYPYWLDHAVQDRRGANFCLNAHYLGAVEDFAFVLSELNEPDATEYQKLGGAVRAGLKTFYDPGRGLFADAMVGATRSTRFSEHANAMALALGIADETQVAGIAEQLLRGGTNDFVQHADGMTMVTPAMSYFLHKGLCEAGFVDQSFDLLQRRFSHMLADGTNGTLWEEWWLDGTGRNGQFREVPAGRSDAQTESAFPPALITEYLLGLNAVSSGMERVVLRYVPTETYLQRKGSIPTPRGRLAVEWNIDAEQFDVALEIPEQTTVDVDTASFGNLGSGDLFVNGKPVDLTASADLQLGEGTYRLNIERRKEG